MSESIRQTVTFDAEPAVIFESLMDSRKHAKFTGQPANIDRKVGGAFTAWGKYIAGYTLAVVKNRSIVQAWRSNDWPKGAWSIVRYTLKSGGRGKTRMMFEQYGVPKTKAKDITAGWKKWYWDLLKAALAPAKPAAKPKATAKTKAKGKAKPKAKAWRKATATAQPGTRTMAMAKPRPLAGSPVARRARRTARRA